MNLKLGLDLSLDGPEPEARDREFVGMIRVETSADVVAEAPDGADGDERAS